MLRTALALAVGALALAPAVADAKPVVAIDTRYHSVFDTVTVSVFPERAAPRGWHYVVYFLGDNQDDDNTGCASFVKKSAYFGRRSFSMRFRPQQSNYPVEGTDRWCEGRARVGLFIERNGNPKQSKARVASRYMYFSE